MSPYFIVLVPAQVVLLDILGVCTISECRELLPFSQGHFPKIPSSRTRLQCVTPCDKLFSFCSPQANISFASLTSQDGGQRIVERVQEDVHCLVLLC
eukprot:2562832-Pyramimonas_sp.AAC.1